MAEQQQDRRTASQKIEDLERGVMALYQTADQMARDVMTIKEAIKLLGNKLDSVVKLVGLKDDDIARVMVENNVAELKGKVDQLVEAGILVPSQTINDSSFVVGSEINEKGEIVNPRIQFTLSSLNPELKDKIKAAKAGDTLELQEGKLKFQVLEAYDIQAPKAPEAPASEVVLDVAAAPAASNAPAPAQDQSAAAPVAPEAAPVGQPVVLNPPLNPDLSTAPSSQASGS
jgi:hypothetical protein